MGHKSKKAQDWHLTRAQFVIELMQLQINVLPPMPETNDAKLKQLDIRKYPNRRYYDATRSQHLTLEDIRLLVRDGYDIRVTDSKTSTDISAKVLAQIILELDGDKIDMFPVALLKRLIRVNDRMAQDFLERYFDQGLSMFLQYRQQFEEQLRKGDAFGGLYSSLANWNRAAMQPFAAAGTGATPAAPNEAAANGKAEAGNLHEKMAVLQAQIARLEAALAAKKRPAPAKKRRTKR
jgi:polyhydroxyalkanoate synthesis repressor PhaR